tara:strand:- start:159 stop:476 length:318 start_codon:yes stop_codon:yes gene_type:complete
MPTTSKSFIESFSGGKITNGAIADHGFDPRAYNSTQPSIEQFKKLQNRYLELINEGLTHEVLHKHVFNFTLVDLLGDEFSWIRSHQINMKESIMKIRAIQGIKNK